MFLTRRKGIGPGRDVKGLDLGLTAPSLLKREGRTNFMGTADEIQENVAAFGKSLLRLVEYKARS